MFYAWGTVNPEGEAGDYNGLFLTSEDIKNAVRDKSLDGLPLKIEHKGVAVGKVVTAWDNRGKLDILVEVDQSVLEGDVVSRFVSHDICKDFSLGYTVGLQYSEAAQTYKPAQKTFNEVSIVRKGARDSCKIQGYSVCGAPSDAKKQRK
jgi:hypothetical protein